MAHPSDPVYDHLRASNLLPKAGPSGRVFARPTVTVLCGSTRFYEAFQRANYERTMAGEIVLSVGFYPHNAELAHGEGVGASSEQKVALDVLHFRKIDLADKVFVLNVGGYVGHSTRREIAYAVATHKPIEWLEPEHGGEAWLEREAHSLGKACADLVGEGQVWNV